MDEPYEAIIAEIKQNLVDTAETNQRLLDETVDEANEKIGSFSAIVHSQKTSIEELKSAIKGLESTIEAQRQQILQLEQQLEARCVCQKKQEQDEGENE